MAVDSSETYEKLLESSLGLSNPLNVDYLLGMIGINDTKTPSLMRGLQRYIAMILFSCDSRQSWCLCNLIVYLFMQ